MKYLIVVYDGMADYPIPALNGGTPMSAAKKPAMDELAKSSLIGTVSNVPSHMVPESDTANLAILSYDPEIYSHGRSPLEALSMGLTMGEDDTAIRCNLVCLSEEEKEYPNRRMLDYSSGEISTAEAKALIDALQKELGNEFFRFHCGISYRHCLMSKIPCTYDFDRPHSITGEVIGPHLPAGDAVTPFRELMEKSYPVLNTHPVNLERAKNGKPKANSIWLWSPGTKPALPLFKDKWGLKGTVVCAVDLIKGIGLCAGMEVPSVEGATGNFSTNYRGKGEAAIDAFRRGSDLVYVHVEAPDESGHHANVEEKIQSIERIDENILSPAVSYLRQSGEPFRVLCLPDHPTPVSVRTHTLDPVPFMIYDSSKPRKGVPVFTEKTAKDAGLYLEHGYELMGLFVDPRPEKEGN